MELIEMKKITKDSNLGFIGIGVMGESMVRNLLAEGYSVHIYTRTKGKALKLIEEGAIWEESVEELAGKCTIIMSMVGFPKDVEEIYFGENGLLKNCEERTTFIDFTTSTPSLAIQINEYAMNHGLSSLDAPVSGGDVGAKNGNLTIMVGGEKEVFENVLPILNIVGSNVILQGKAGSGQHTKMCNQIAIASNMIGVCESLVYARKAGLNQEQVLKSISFGAAGSWSLSNLAPRIIDEDFEPGFYIKHFIKDMQIAIDESKAMGLELVGLQLSKKLYDILAMNGEENSGTQALYKSYLTK